MRERTFDGGYRSPEEIQTTLNRLADAPKPLVLVNHLDTVLLRLLELGASARAVSPGVV